MTLRDYLFLCGAIGLTVAATAWLIVLLNGAWHAMVGDEAPDADRQPWQMRDQATNDRRARLRTFQRTR